jgi:MFS family permease
MSRGYSLTQFSREFYLVIGFATLTFIAMNMTFSIFSLYLDEKGASSFELGLIISLMSYTTLTTQIPLGLITRRVGVWWVIPLALIGQSTSYFLYSLAPLPYFYPIRIFHAVVSASLQPTLLSYASAIAPEDKRGEAIGVYLSSVGVAMMSGPLLNSLLLMFVGYQTILIIASMIPLIALMLYVYLLRVDVFRRHFTRTSNEKLTRVDSWNSLKAIFTLRSVQTLTVIRFTFAFTMSILTTLYAIYAVNTLGVSPSIYAFYITLKGMANTIARFPAGRITDIIGRKKPLLFSFILLSIVFFFLSEVKHPILVGFLIFFHGISHGTRAVSEWSMLSDVVRSEDRELAHFYFSTVFSLGSALGATFAGSAAMVLSTPVILKIAAVLTSSSIFIVAITKFPRK